jgi:hypothetical protein
MSLAHGFHLYIARGVMYVVDCFRLFPMSPDSNKNRRGSIRKRPRGWLMVDCRKRGTMGPSIADVVWDVSQTGLCLVSNVELMPNDDLELQITSISLNQMIKTLGRVVWVDMLDNKKYSVGVRFEQNLPYQTISQLTL